MDFASMRTMPPAPKDAIAPVSKESGAAPGGAQMKNARPGRAF
jgi:hypothetical protein